jgi:guanylate kinase
MNDPKLFVISAPSGGGKTTIVKAILERHPDFEFSVSATTRPKRKTETEGKDYFFLEKNDFEKLLRDGNLVEHEQIYGDYYGTLKSEVERAFASGRCMVFDVDVRGALSIKERYGEAAVLIFIEPPTKEVLERRLLGRKTEDEETFRRRMERAAMELETGKRFDYRVVNDVLEKAINDVDKIIQSHVSLS